MFTVKLVKCVSDSSAIGNRKKEEMTNVCALVGRGKRATPLKKARGKQFQTPGNEHYNAILRGMK